MHTTEVGEKKALLRRGRCMGRYIFRAPHQFLLQFQESSFGEQFLLRVAGRAAAGKALVFSGEQFLLQGCRVRACAEGAFGRLSAHDCKPWI